MKIKVLMMILGVMILYSCDHTDLSGNIVILSDSLVYDETIPLILQVPDELEGIHKVFWSVHLKDQPGDPLDILIYGEELLDSYTEKELLEIFDLKEINYDRIALLKSKVQGTYILEVQGYYKQTNPQPITSLEITIE